MAARYPGGSVSPGLRFRPQAAGAQGLQYRPGYAPMNPWRQTAAGGLQGLGGLLMALGAGQPQQALPAFQGGLAAQDEAERRRAEQARQDELFAFEREDRAASKAERDRERREAEAARAAWQPIMARLSDADPSNDPTSLRDILPFLPIEAQMQMAGELFPEPPKPTDDMREYERAVEQGFNGTLLDYQTALRRAGAGGSSTTIYNKDYGSIPPGHRLVEGPDGVRLEALPVEALPGSPAATEAAAAQAAEAAATAKKQQTGSIVVQDIDRALKLVDEAWLPTTGWVGEKLSGLAGTSAHDVMKLTDTIRANAGFAELQAMRDQSPTGGALGQVTERELAFLQSTIGNLEQSQSKDQFKDNLKRVKNVYLDIIHGPNGGPVREPLSFEGGQKGDEWIVIDGVRIRKKP